MYLLRTFKIFDYGTYHFEKRCIEHCGSVVYTPYYSAANPSYHCLLIAVIAEATSCLK